MKVLHVVDAIDASRGAGMAERTLQLATALHRAGVECSILCTDLGLDGVPPAEIGDVDLVIVPTLLKRFLVPLISAKRLDQLVSQADVIHVTGHWSILGARVCLAAQRVGKPYVYCPAGSLKIFGRSAWLKHLFNLALGNRSVRGAARCLMVTDLEREQFHEYGLPDASLALLPNGVHFDSRTAPVPAAFRHRYGLQSKQILLFLGRLSPIKGPDLLLEAFIAIADRHPESVLVFAGPENELGAALKDQVGRLGLEHRVLFIGFIGGQDKQDALAAADLLIVPSRREAMSLVALEAGLCGTPVLLTDQCGFNDVEEVDGGAVVPAQVDAIASGIDRMLGAFDGLRNQGQRLRELVLARYTWDGLTIQACKLYRELMERNHHA